MIGSRDAIHGEAMRSAWLVCAIAFGCGSSPVVSPPPAPPANTPTRAAAMTDPVDGPRSWIDGPREERGAYHSGLGARIHICVPALLEGAVTRAGILYEHDSRSACDEAPRVRIYDETYLPRDAANMRPPWNGGRVLQLDYSRQLITRVTDFEKGGDHWLEVEHMRPFEHQAITCAAACSTRDAAAIPGLVHALNRICRSIVFGLGASANLQAPKGSCPK